MFDKEVSPEGNNEEVVDVDKVETEPEVDPSVEEKVDERPEANWKAEIARKEDQRLVEMDFGVVTQAENPAGSMIPAEGFAAPNTYSGPMPGFFDAWCANTIFTPADRDCSCR